jgi:flagellar basal body-associated protein FliL
MTEKNVEQDSNVTKKRIYMFALIIMLIVIIGASFKLFTSLNSKDVTEPVAVALPVVEVEEKKVVEHVEEQQQEQSNQGLTEQIEPELTQPPDLPLVEVEPVKTLPQLNDSDLSVKTQLSQYFAKQTLKLVVQDDMIRRFVVYVDNIGKGKIAKKHSPIIEPQASFTVVEGDILTIAPQSYERYTPFVELFTSMTPQQAVNFYKEYKPLFDEAYEEIGYQERDFDDAVFDAIDMVLTTPIVTGNVPLLSESVVYKYAYSEWEQLPEAQKQLLRMGAKNVKKVKSALKGIKTFLETSE